jgi:hypothetical protein
LSDNNWHGFACSELRLAANDGLLSIKTIPTKPIMESCSPVLPSFRFGIVPDALLVCSGWRAVRAISLNQSIRRRLPSLRTGDVPWRPPGLRWLTVHLKLYIQACRGEALLCSARKAVHCPPLELSVADGARVESFNRFRSTWSLFHSFALRLVAYGALGSE